MVPRRASAASERVEPPPRASKTSVQVGGGILAIPTVAAEPGFWPSTLLIIALWAANVGTGLLLGEVSAAAVRRGEEDVSLRALSRGALGENGARLTSFFYAGTNLLLMGARRRG